MAVGLLVKAVQVKMEEICIACSSDFAQVRQVAKAKAKAKGKSATEFLEGFRFCSPTLLLPERVGHSKPQHKVGQRRERIKGA